SRNRGADQAEPEVRHEVELDQPHRVGADAEERAVAERRQPRVAEQQVEPEREDAPDQDFDAEIGIEADLVDPVGQRSEDEKGDEHRWRDQGAGRARTLMLRQARRVHASSTLFLPNRPRARKVTTAISRMYIEIKDQSVAKAPVRPTTMPTISPARTAPQKL